ncbi:MAG: hypothetical protein RIR95_2019 [Pseudomonadota bacterium]
MTLKSILLASAFSLFAGIAQAAVTADALAADFQAQGFTAIEVKQGLTQIKVEAIKNGMKTEVIYDMTTGAVLKTQVYAVQAGDHISDGIKIVTRDSDFLNDGEDSGSDDSDSSSDDNGGDDDDSDGNDDNSGHDGDHDSSHDGSGHDSNDSNDD